VTTGAPEDTANKPSLRQGRDPLAEKKKDLARQRKIASNASDKAARRHAPLIKATANRGARRASKVPVVLAESDYSESAQAAVVHHRTKGKNWGSINAAEHRALRTEENGVLDETAALPGLPKGRRRATTVPVASDRETLNGKK
jgi:hypothetical protein